MWSVSGLVWSVWAGQSDLYVAHEWVGVVHVWLVWPAYDSVNRPVWPICGLYELLVWPMYGQCGPCVVSEDVGVICV